MADVNGAPCDSSRFAVSSGWSQRLEDAVSRW